MILNAVCLARVELFVCVCVCVRARFSNQIYALAMTHVSSSYSPFRKYHNGLKGKQQQKNKKKEFRWKNIRNISICYYQHINAIIFFISFSSFYFILFDIRFESIFLVLYCVDWSFAQNFANCDFYKELTPNVVYSFTSPNYNKPYAPGTFCRYTGTMIDSIFFSNFLLEIYLNFLRTIQQVYLSYLCVSFCI